MEHNLPKTVVVPLWPSPLENIKSDISLRLPAWSGVDVADCSRYLGFMTGPGKGTESWDEAVDKYLDRARLRGLSESGSAVRCEDARRIRSDCLVVSSAARRASERRARDRGEGFEASGNWTWKLGNAS